MRDERRTKRTTGRLGAALTVALLGGGALAAASALDEGDGAAERTKLRLILDRDGATDRLKIDDLGELAVGESRSYATEGGQSVVATRDEAGVELDVEGKKIRVHDLGKPGEGDAIAWQRRRIEVEDESGDGKTMVVLSADHAQTGDVHVVRRGGPGGAHGFAFGGVPLPPPFGVEATIERLEANAKFQGLDAATRATVLEALRESMPQPLAGELDGEPVPGERVIVLDVREKGEE